MPASRRSLRVTEAYRTRLRAIQNSLARDIRAVWATIDPDDLDGSFRADRVAVLTESAQRRSLQASIGYLSAFLTSELEHKATGPSPTIPLGTTRSGRPLIDAAEGALIGVKVAIGEGKSVDDALASGRAVLLRSVGVSADAVARQALTAGFTDDDRIIGWRRAVRGTCGACLGAAVGSVADPVEEIDIHPGCQCIQEPVVAGVPNRVPRPTGAQLFAAMSIAHQTELLGVEKAELVRTGQAELRDLVDHSPMKHEDDFLTETPVSALT